MYFSSGKMINSGNFAAAAEIINIIMKTENQHLKLLIEKGISFIFILMLNKI